MEIQEDRKRSRNRSSENLQKAVKICHQFANGTCQFGDRCRFSHAVSGNVSSVFSNLASSSSSTTPNNAPTRSSAPPSSEICRKFLEGKCTRGNSCRFQHTAPLSASQAFSSAQAAAPACPPATSTMAMGTNPNKKSSVSSYMTQSLFALPISVQSKRACDNAIFEHVYCTGGIIAYYSRTDVGESKDWDWQNTRVFDSIG